MTELETKLLGALKDAREHINQDWYSVESQCEMLSHLDDCIAAAEAAQPDEVQRAVEAEREACAKVCDPQPGIKYSPNSHSARQQCAAAIRARGNKH